MEKANKIVLTAFLIVAIIALANVASALTIVDVQSSVLYPGKSGELKIIVENEGNDDIKDVSFSLNLADTPISTLGSSEETIDEIDSDDSDAFVFTLSANADAKTGDYNIPYTLSYENASVKKGTIGIKIRAVSSLDYTSSFDNPVIGEKSKLSLKIINKGLGEAKFVSVQVEPDGYTLLSDEKVYIGNIDSDDFETATFDVVINSKNSNLIATVTYQDLDNKAYTEQVDIPLTAYTLDKAYSLGIKTKSNVPYYIGAIVLIIVIWFVVRAIRKSIRKRRSMQNLPR